MPTTAPVLEHRNLRFLLRAFVDAHPQFRALSAQTLCQVLAPAMAIAWWSARNIPAVAARGSFRVLVAGAGAIECMDGGRWLSFLPWLLGQPGGACEVVLVGDQLTRGLQPSQGKSIESLRAEWATPLASLVQDRRPASIFNGRLAQYASEHGGLRSFDLCVLSHPGLEVDPAGWLNDAGMEALAARACPMVAFGYSELDVRADQHILHCVGALASPIEVVQNPFSRDSHQDMGAFGGYAWRWPDIAPARALDFESADVARFLDSFELSRAEFAERGDAALRGLGDSHVRKRRGGGEVSLIKLPRGFYVSEADGELGDLGWKGQFTPLEPSVRVPLSVLRSRPGPDFLHRQVWAVEVFRHHLDPVLRSQSDRLFAGVTKGSMEGCLGDILERIGHGDVDPQDFMEQMRASGGLRGPMHPNWADLLETLGWRLSQYVEEPVRLTPAFVLEASQRRILLPAIVENYAYMPDDPTDDLAQEAMAVVSARHPDGAVLFFNGIPVCTIDGKPYAFGGMLWWQRKWRPFALCANMSGADALLEQAEAGFSFDKPLARYADDPCLSVPFARMCHGLDPNEDCNMVSLRLGKWATLMPG
ncbi:hypothetical protein GHT07_20630 [Caenimonas koreensis DSM 17982]|uniref:Uncharacterized protein n=1 Tax=Caenimonas koreensis DSM 17982 TaxID=1121255 RepID=A0A844B965_9BURK|nr:hypothetical protein [Caenimonas koreensis]MRD49683.1 hypothetical protein [Caenimonas koreensis DSM 17982]